MLERNGQSTDFIKKRDQDQEMKEEAYWNNPENQHRGFERYEILMRELREDYSRHQEEISTDILHAMAAASIDKNTNPLQRRFNKNSEFIKPERRDKFLDEYAKTAVADMLINCCDSD